MGNKRYTEQLLNQTKDLVWMVDQNLHLVYANKAYLNLTEEITGVVKELNTSILLGGFNQDQVEKWSVYYERALSGEAFSVEEHFIHPVNKAMQYGHISFSPIKDINGKIESVACRNIDITSCTTEKYRADSLIDASLDVFCTIDEAGRFVYVSAASTEQWGYHPDELIGKPYRKLIIEEDKTKTDKIAAEVIAGKTLKSFNNRYQKKNGGIAYNFWSAKWDQKNKLMYCVARDVKDKIAEEHQLKLLSSVITNTNDAVLITEAEPVKGHGPKIIYVNEAFTKMTGYKAEEVIGKTPTILQGPKSNFKDLAKLGKALENWESFEVTTINYKKNGEEFWVNFTVTPVADENGWYTHWIAIERDVTAQKNAELEKALFAEISTCFSEGDLNQSGEKLCELIHDFADFDLVELWCPNLEQSHVTRTAAFTNLTGFKSTNNTYRKFLKGEGLQGKIWEQKTQILWSQKEIKKFFLRKQQASELGLANILGVPLTHQNQIVGILIIGNKTDTDRLKKFSELLKTLETLIGSEIHRKRLEIDLNHLYEATPEILCIADFEGRFLKMSPAGYELLGYSEKEILFHSFEDFVHPDDKANTKNEVDFLSQGSSIFDFENRYITKEGKIIWLSWSCKPSLKDGLIYCAGKNISTEKKLWELSKQAAQLAKIGSWEYDLVENTLFWSDAVYHIYNVDPTTFLPTLENSLDFYKEEYKSYVSSEITKSLKEGIYLDYEAIIVTKNNKEKWLRVMGKPEFIDGKCVKFIGSIQDITHNREAESRLQNLSDNIPGVVFQYVIHPDGKDEFKYISNGAYKIWGYSPEEVIKNRDLVWNQVQAGGDFNKVKQSIIDSVENKSKWFQRYRIVKPNGEKRILQGVGTPDFLSDGTIVYSTVVTDVTEESKNEELLELASELAQIGSWEVDVENEKLFWSETVHELHQTDAKTFKPGPDSSINFYREDFRPMVRSEIAKSMETGSTFGFEAVIVTAKKEERWIKAIGNSEIIEGQCKRVYGSIQNIHERKENELRLRAITNDLPGVTFQYILSPDGKDHLKGVSKASVKLWNLTPKACEEDIQLVWNQIQKGGDLVTVQKSIQDSIINNTQWNAQWKNILPNGELRWHEGFGTPNMLVDGTIFFNSLIFDITERKQAEQQLLNINKKLKTQTKDLERSNKELEEFAFITSHDLQEPLRMISSFMGQLERKYADQLDDKAKQYIYFAKDGAHRMKQIILDLLNYSRINKPTDLQEIINLNEIVSDFLRLRGKLIAEKQAVIHMGQLPTILTFKAPVTQLLHCLLDNALKYTKENIPPQIHVQVVDKGKFWEFAIKDNGIGINDKFYDKVFVLFQRLHNRENSSGTGIGLSVAKRAVEFLGGKIWVASKVGEGSTFYFTILKTTSQN